MIRGVGPVYAKKLVRAFGEQVFDVIEATPGGLATGHSSDLLASIIRATTSSGE